MRFGIADEPCLKPEHIAPSTVNSAGGTTSTNPPSQNVSPMENSGPKIPIQSAIQGVNGPKELRLDGKTIVIVGLAVVVLYMMFKGGGKAVAA